MSSSSTAKRENGLQNSLYPLHHDISSTAKTLQTKFENFSDNANVGECDSADDKVYHLQTKCYFFVLRIEKLLKGEGKFL